MVSALAGVWLGAQLNQTTSERQDVERVLTEIEITFDSIRTSNLAAMMSSLDRDELEAWLGRLEPANILTPARSALAAVRVRHRIDSVRKLAAALDTDLWWAHNLTLKWYKLAIDNLNVTDPIVRSKVNDALHEANEAQSRTDSHRQQLRTAAGLDRRSGFRLRR
jgi:hypothetical protein